MIHLISLGAGVQSSTMALMAAHGEITPMPQGAVFADTGAEPAKVYEWLDWLETQLPFPVRRVAHGSLADDSLEVRRSKRSGELYCRNLVPLYILKPNGAKGMLPRKCTKDYKINPIYQFESPLAKQSGLIQWIGISTDEAHRMKPSPKSWATNRYPFIELGMSRDDCFAWMEKHGYPKPPRSACVFCVYHNDREWLRLKTEEPEEFEKAAVWEERVQAASAQATGCGRINGVPFVHSSLVPLRQVTFSDSPHQPNLFGNECEGICGV